MAIRAPNQEALSGRNSGALGSGAGRQEWASRKSLHDAVISRSDRHLPHGLACRSTERALPPTQARMLHQMPLDPLPGGQVGQDRAPHPRRLAIALQRKERKRHPLRGAGQFRSPLCGVAMATVGPHTYLWRKRSGVVPTSLAKALAKCTGLLKPHFDATRGTGRLVSRNSARARATLRRRTN